MNEATRIEPPRGFPVSEYERRTERAQALLGARGLAALLVCTEPEVRYFTGFHTPFWHSPTRPFFVVIPAEGQPIAIIPTIGASSMASTWITDIRTWPAPRPDDDGVSLLAETLRELTGSAAAVIGVPMGPETHLRMPLADWNRLTGMLATVTFADATDVVRSLRMVKSEREIEKIAHVCHVVSDAFAGLGDLVTIGMSERDAFRAFRIDLLRRGVDEVPYLVGATGTTLSSIIDQPRDRRIEPGDLLMFDTGSVWDGYWSDFDRNVSFDHADDLAKRAYEALWQATEAGLRLVRPGLTTSELFEAMAAALEEAATVDRSVGRFGHGLGMQLTEWPSNTATDHTVLAENMVITLEPAVEFAPGRLMVHEENIVIRAEGPELLSRRAPPSLPVI